MKHEVITASAGSGKTYRLSNRIISLLLDEVAPAKIIALTFTRKAAGEFSGALFEKLAKAASSEQFAMNLSKELGRDARTEDYLIVLQKVVETLPDLYLGTLDSFFTRIVQAFQLELGLSSGGGLKILEGSELEELRTRMVEELLTSVELSEGNQRALLQDFKEADFGREKVSVRKTFLSYIDDWYSHYQSLSDTPWGNVSPIIGDRELSAFEKRVEEYTSAVSDVFYGRRIGHKTADKVFDGLPEMVRNFVGGAGFKPNKVIDNLLENLDDLKAGIPVSFKYSGKLVELDPEQSRKMGRVLQAMVDDELRINAERSAAIFKVMQIYDLAYNELGRNAGNLAFDDLKQLLGKWKESEQDRLTREAIDYRLDGRYDHWLLDEFQDTSQEQWDSLEPLIDEVGQDRGGQRSLFVVGDVKQSIYQWRGGDSKLFLEVARRYDINPEGMAESWRSQEPVLELVNTVFGSDHEMRTLFGSAVDKWDWEDHKRAEGLPEKPAYSEVYECEPDSKSDYILKKVKEISPSEKGLSCALLVRTGAQVKSYANLLRSEGIAAAEEGKIQPANDNPFGLLMLDWLRWMANPKDSYAERHLCMSPLSQHYEQLLENVTIQWQIWNEQLNREGLIDTLEAVLSPLQEKSSAFALERQEHILVFLRSIHGDLDSIIRQLENFEISVAQSSEVVQVMTVHQSKGLGFDVVIVPEISNDSIINGGRFRSTLVRSDQGLAFLSPPASWTYPAFTPIEEDFNRWKLEEYFSEFCVLYVALTRAKQALYCVLEKPKSKKRKQKDSLADWIIETLPDHNVKDEGMLFQRGDSNWFSQIEEKVLPDVDSSTLEINLSKKRSRSTKSKQFRRTAFSDSCGIEQGLQVHDLLECVDWLPAYPEPLPEDFVMVLDHFEQGATYVAKFMLPEIRKLFIKPKGEHKLFREQSIEWIGKDGLWNTVRLDRFVVHYDQGTPVKIQLIDYKTDKAGSLEGKYEAQMRHYEEGLKTIYGEVPIETHLLAIGM